MVRPNQRKAAAVTPRARRPRSRAKASARHATSHRGSPNQRVASNAPPTGSPVQKAFNEGRTAYGSVIREFENGIRYLYKGESQKAAEVFEKLTNSPVREVADRARIHLRRCVERKEYKTAAPRTAEEYYLQGVAALNNRQMSLAVEWLSKSDKLEPHRDHVQYALGAAYALQRQTEQALRHLQESIRLRPANRTLARNDEDFQTISDEPRFRQLLAGGSC